MKKILYLTVIIALAAGCAPQKQKSGAAVGGQRDKHGCLTSAGYTWSEVRKDCIRPWEEGMQFTAPEGQKDATQAAYAVFSRDSSKVEVFLPGRKPVVLLRGGSSAPSWMNIAGDAVMNSPSKGWALVNSVDGRMWMRSAK